MGPAERHPAHPDENRLAVHTEDHPLEYIEFEGEIPKGEYGAGTMEIWDRGTYETEKWRDDEVIATFHGERVQGRYVLFPTRGKDWMIHRMDPPADPRPSRSRPPRADEARSVSCPATRPKWGFEIKWDGIRAIVYCSPATSASRAATSRTSRRAIRSCAPLTRELGARTAILDGEIVAFDAKAGRASSASRPHAPGRGLRGQAPREARRR